MKMLKMKIFDFMIENKLYQYDVDPWNRNDEEFFRELKGEKIGQINYKDEIFVLSYTEGNGSRGGMDMGTPDIFTIIRIKPNESKPKTT